MRGFGTTYPKIPSSTAGEAGKEPGLNTWVAMATVTLGALLEEKTARGVEWRRREWRETRRKIGEGEDCEKKQRMEKLIAPSFFSLVGVDDEEESHWFSAMSFLLRECAVIYMKPGELAQI